MGKNIIHAEWIGKHATVAKATNKTLIGIEGTVVDETKNTISIETPSGVKNVQKRGTVFTIDGQEVPGDKVLASPEERIKLKVK